MPSPRPANPRRSVVVAFTLTSPTSQPRSAARFARIAGTCGASFGACAISVASRLPIRHPAVEAATPRLAQQHPAVGALPSRIRVGEVRAEVAQRQRAEDRVADRVEQHVGVGMSVEAAIERNRDAAQDEPAPCDERVHVEAVADAHRHASRLHSETTEEKHCDAGACSTMRRVQSSSSAIRSSSSVRNPSRS